MCDACYVKIVERLPEFLDQCKVLRENIEKNHPKIAEKRKFDEDTKMDDNNLRSSSLVQQQKDPPSYQFNHTFLKDE